MHKIGNIGIITNLYHPVMDVKLLAKSIKRTWSLETHHR